MEAREFQEQDWSGFSGATKWDDGKAPLLAKGNLADGREYVVVLDATGGCLLVEGDEANDEGGRVLECVLPTQEAALAFARGCGDPREVADFLALGFYRSFPHPAANKRSVFFRCFRPTSGIAPTMHATDSQPSRYAAPHKTLQLENKC